MEYSVIDADGHILEPPDLWENYMDPKFRHTCPKLLIMDAGGEILRIEGDDVIDLKRGKKPLKSTELSDRAPPLGLRNLAGWEGSAPAPTALIRFVLPTWRA